MTTILIVDDEQDMRNLINVMLRQSGFQTLQANSGYEALKVVTEHPIDLIILDIMMPKKDGFAVLDEIQKQQDQEEISIIMVTSKSLSKEESNFLKNRVRQIIEKSGTQFDKIMAAISEIIQAKTQTK